MQKCLVKVNRDAHGAIWMQLAQMCAYQSTCWCVCVFCSRQWKETASEGHLIYLPQAAPYKVLLSHFFCSKLSRATKPLMDLLPTSLSVPVTIPDALIYATNPGYLRKMAQLHPLQTEVPNEWYITWIKACVLSVQVSLSCSEVLEEQQAGWV